MPPLYPLLLLIGLLIGLPLAAFSKLGWLITAFTPAALLTGALLLTDWDFTVDLRALLYYFLPAFLFALAGALCGSFLGRKFRKHRIAR